MARPKQDGLKYFSFDTDFFYADKRIRRLHSRYGNDGLVFFIYLLTEIYRNGYYARWDEDIIDDAIGLNLTEGFIEQVMLFLKTRELIVEIDIEASNRTDAVITSPGIQKRYQEAMKGLKRDVYVDADIWLLERNDTADFIKFTSNENKSEKNPDKSGINENKSKKNPIKEKKQKENIINKDNMCKADALALFERLWKLYPCKRGKGRVTEKKKMELLSVGEEQMILCIKRYKEELKKDSDWRNPQNGSTFFNSGYIDYLDDNFTPAPVSEGSQSTFHNFNEREYNYEELQKKLANL